jgi:hypothetical protein
MKLLMSLATASLVLPLTFVKAFTANGPAAHSLRPAAYWSWGFLGGSLLFGMLCYWASTKFAKVVYGGPESISEQSFEKVRDVSIAGAVLCFFVGLALALCFLANLYWG